MPRRKLPPQVSNEATEPSEQRLEAMGEALRAKYSDVKTERIPDRLQRLIDALKEAEHKASETDET